MDCKQQISNKLGLNCLCFQSWMVSKTHTNTHTQSTVKVFTPIELLHTFFSHYDHKPQCVLVGFYVMDRHKEAHSCEVKGKLWLSKISPNKNLKSSADIGFSSAESAVYCNYSFKSFGIHFCKNAQAL